jgi:hypothetical protein
MKKQILSLAALLTLASVAAHAHHSIAGVYDSAREATVDGVITAFQFVSPHPFVDIQDGRTRQPWRLEMDNRGELEDIGFAPDTLKPGDRIVVIGSLARREANRMYIRRLDRPADGFSYEQVGNSPRLRARQSSVSR